MIKLKENRINLTHIESRPCKADKRKYEFFVDCSAESSDVILEAIEKLKMNSSYLHILNKDGTETENVDSGKS